MAYASALVDLPVLEAVRGQRVYAIYAYGSLAQPGGGTRQSDLDLMIVGDIKNRLTVTERLNEIGQRLHRAIDPFYVSPEQFESSKERGDPQVASALAGVRIMGSA
jgi:predicted nucleotidyltransferase